MLQMVQSDLSSHTVHILSSHTVHIPESINSGSDWSINVIKHWFMFQRAERVYFLAFTPLNSSYHTISFWATLGKVIKFQNKIHLQCFYKLLNVKTGQIWQNVRVEYLHESRVLWSHLDKCWVKKSFKNLSACLMSLYLCFFSSFYRLYTTYSA